MANYITIDPTRVYQINNQVCKPVFFGTDYAVGNNQLVVTAVTGQRIKVLFVSAQSPGAVGFVKFKSASGGTVLSSTMGAPTAGGSYQLGVCDCGYFETITGEGLYVDVTTNAVGVQIVYITYTP